MTEPAKHRLIIASLLSTTFLTGCVVWQSDYDALQAQNQQLQHQAASDQQQISRLQGAIKYTVNSDLLFAPSLIPSFQTSSKSPLNDRHCDTVSAKRAISGDSLCSAIVGMRS
jgi:hypothetical protein